MTKRRWLFIVFLTLSLIEAGVIGYHQVSAQATATPAATPTATPAATAAMTATAPATPAGTATPAAASPSATPAAAGAAMTSSPEPTATSTATPVTGGVSYAERISRLDRAPSGNTSEAAKVYYDYIYANYVENLPGLRTDIMWSGPFWIFFWALLMIGFFLLYAHYLQNVHRRKGELYESTSFAGSILERVGRVAVFSYLVWTAIVLWGLWYIVTHILWGQIY